MCKVIAKTVVCPSCTDFVITELEQQFCDERVYLPPQDRCHCDKAMIEDDLSRKPVAWEDRDVCIWSYSHCRHSQAILFGSFEVVFNMVPFQVWADYCASIGWTATNAGNLAEVLQTPPSSTGDTTDSDDYVLMNPTFNSDCHP
ncbi:hypothetical protein VHEMI02344 [[Torrubiella] hemipterigena]|uniref:Uncharacterized protein n=1 Tax=[Torrubiella] hemipterigena TaxID=1531966 RepID=A0A0A1SPD3_9HYPO|nr:hypothetical protein VHEMI02344 [[Torrubiella] hemipterigena]